MPTRCEVHSLKPHNGQIVSKLCKFGDFLWVNTCGNWNWTQNVNSGKHWHAKWKIEFLLHLMLTSRLTSENVLEFTNIYVINGKIILIFRVVGLGLWCLTPLSDISEYLEKTTDQSHWLTLSHNILSRTPCLGGFSNSQLGRAYERGVQPVHRFGVLRVKKGPVIHWRAP